MSTPEITVKQLVKYIRANGRGLSGDVQHLRERIVDETSWVDGRAARRHAETQRLLYVGFGLLAASLLARGALDAYKAHEYATTPRVITIYKDRTDCKTSDSDDGAVGALRNDRRPTPAALSF